MKSWCKDIVQQKINTVITIKAPVQSARMTSAFVHVLFFREASHGVAKITLVLRAQRLGTPNTIGFECRRPSLICHDALGAAKPPCQPAAAEQCHLACRSPHTPNQTRTFHDVNSSKASTGDLARVSARGSSER